MSVRTSPGWRLPAVVIPTLAAVSVLCSPACLRMVDYDPPPVPCEEQFDLTSDPDNCGACGVQCDGRESCVAGTCECQPQWPDRCGSWCRDLSSDKYNCGQCGLECAVDAPCSEGVCHCDGAVCNGRCISVAEDVNNCGACGLKCATGQLCTKGKCWAQCAGTQTGCESRTKAACNAGCWWGEGCSGGWKSCSKYDHSCTTCSGTKGCIPCDSSGHCGGTAHCEELTSIFCNEYLGCTWKDACRGSPTPCEQLSASECASAPGCTVQSAPK